MKPKTFEPDLTAADARYLHELALRCSARPGWNLDPMRQLFRDLADSAAAGGPVQAVHRLDRDQAAAVHAAMQSSVSRLSGLGADVAYQAAAAIKLLASWERHTNWKPGDLRRRQPAGPGPDYGGPVRLVG